ncbi:MAG: DUF2283 domain-containing protein [Candidatus Hydrogenedentes bacterium]|nr:DUF2283 domain-containing protein [Candidatus Hydrogenedentota bacterium]MBI3117473.1 DUF2283 domain-containing protein [Candidatus Hydrogenedentota bacterium]
MKIHYFTETDTALLEFADAAPEETRALSDSVYADFDKKGNMVALTIEHAHANANLNEVAFLRVSA